MSVQDNVPDTGFGPIFAHLLTANVIESELMVKTDNINELNINNGVLIEGNLLKDTYIQSDEYRMMNSVGDSYVSLIANPNLGSGITYQIQFPDDPPNNDELLMYNGISSALAWTEFVEGTDISISITNSQITISSSFFLAGVTTVKQLGDDDQDTLVQVERTNDDDLIRFKTQGTDIGYFGTTGLFVGSSGDFLIRNDGTIYPTHITNAPINSLYHTGTHLAYKNDIGCILNLETDNNITKRRQNFTISGNDYYNRVDLGTTGSMYITILNEINKGACANFYFSKSYDEITSSIVKLTGSPGYPNTSKLNSEWDLYSGSGIGKTTGTYDGTYSYKTFLRECSNITSDITLTGVSYTIVSNKTYGNLFLQIESNIEGAPVAHFCLSKSSPSITASIVKLTWSPGKTTNENLAIKWETNSSSKLNKNGNNYDGIYKCIQLFNKTDLYTKSIILSGTTYSKIHLEKDRMVSFISIEGSSGFPCALFSIAKNTRINTPSIVRLTGSPGLITGEKLELRWNANSTIELHKSGNGYDGTYNVIMII